MIIDDDKLIISDLINIIDWAAQGFSVVATAYNGKQGLVKYRQFMPHVVFTDIKMPLMDGLEMLCIIRRLDTAVRFVILTAFGEFGYAKQALELGASAYLLKNQLTEQSLLAMLETVKAELIEQSRIVFLTVVNTIRAFLAGDRKNLDETLQNLKLTFDGYSDCPAQWDMRSMTGVVGEMFQDECRKNEKKEFYEPPPVAKDEVLDWMAAQLKQAAHWAREAESRMSSAISQALSFIRKNYSNKDMNIQTISDYLTISPSWLSVSFRKETGQTVNEYITNVRIDEAKRLLRQGKHKVYEIAERVGYGSSRYFSKVFIQTTGYSPQSFGRE